MSFNQTFQKIESSTVFQNLKQQYPDVQFVAGFFILDFLFNDNKQTLDYKTDSKIFTFTLHPNNDITVQEDKLIEIPNTPKLTPIKNIPEIKIELNDLKGIAGTSALDNGISAKFHKIIAVFQNHENQLVWNLTCMLEQLIILHILINPETGEIIKFERKSMMDMVKRK